MSVSYRVSLGAICWLWLWTRGCGTKHFRARRIALLIFALQLLLLNQILHPHYCTLGITDWVCGLQSPACSVLLSLVIVWSTFDVLERSQWWFISFGMKWVTHFCLSVYHVFFPLRLWMSQTINADGILGTKSHFTFVVIQSLIYQVNKIWKADADLGYFIVVLVSFSRSSDIMLATCSEC